MELPRQIGKGRLGKAEEAVGDGRASGVCMGPASGFPGTVGREKACPGTTKFVSPVLGFSVVCVHKYMYLGTICDLGATRGTFYSED